MDRLNRSKHSRSQADRQGSLRVCEGVTMQDYRSNLHHQLFQSKLQYKMREQYFDTCHAFVFIRHMTNNTCCHISCPYAIQNFIVNGKHKLFIRICFLYATSTKSVNFQRVILALKKFSCINLTCKNLSSMQEFTERVEELLKIYNLKEKRCSRRFISIP